MQSTTANLEDNPGFFLTFLSNVYCVLCIGTFAYYLLHRTPDNHILRSTLSHGVERVHQKYYYICCCYH